MTLWYNTAPITATAPFYNPLFYPTAAATTATVTTGSWYPTQQQQLYFYLAQAQQALEHQQQAYQNQFNAALAQQHLREAQHPMQPPPQAPAVHGSRVSEARAREVARELLLSFLTPEQRAEFAQAQHFHLRTRSGRLYRIDKGIAGNILELEGGAARARLCCHADYSSGMPDYDHMLAQLLALNDNEEQFRRTANFTPVR